MAKNSVKIDTNGLKNDIRKYLKTYAQSYAKQAQTKLTEQAKSSIEMFYNDYSPIFYVRTDNLLDSFVPYYKNNGKAFYGGVRITSSMMSPYYSGGIMNQSYTDPLTVAQLAWHGWHGDPTGYNGKFDPIYTTPPLDTLLKYANHKVFLNMINQYAETKALKQKYKYLQFR